MTTAQQPVSDEQFATLPKVVLHDHLDGGVRAQTVLELAHEIGYADLPADTEGALAQWFIDSADSGSLERYLATFTQTLAVMQTADALTRVAREAVIDHARDGVVYAELRYAPEQHCEKGLTEDEVVLAVEEGLREGERQARDEGHQIQAGALLTAMRHASDGMKAARLTINHAAREGNKVAGFDIAGPEDGFSPTRQLGAFRTLREAMVHYTIHAGEAAGPTSVAEAALNCGAERLGHGVRIAEDLTIDGVPVAERAAELPYAQWSQADVERVKLGKLAAYVRDRQIPMEVCPLSNLQTAAAPSMEGHPITLLSRLGFAVTINTDNRLMSGTSMTREMTNLADSAGWGLADFERATVAAARAAFLPYPEREALIADVIQPAYAAAQE